MVEVSDSTKTIDMRQKRDDYRRANVLEYLVLCVKEQELYWWHFPSGRMIKPNRQGISRSRVFPGLWIDGRALLARDTKRPVKERAEAVREVGLAKLLDGRQPLLDMLAAEKDTELRLEIVRNGEPRSLVAVPTELSD